MANGYLPKDDIKREPVVDEFAYLRHYYDYNPHTGKLVKMNCFHTKRNGTNAVFNAPNKRDNATVYLRVNKKVVCLTAWKVAYYLLKGEYLGRDYDCLFRDGDKFNLKVSNMVIMNRSDFFHYKNSMLKGFGVKKTPNGEKSRSNIKVKGVTKYLGTFNTEKEARIAYMQEKVKVREQAVNLMLR
jgi:hypothetical protein